MFVVFSADVPATTAAKIVAERMWTKTATATAEVAIVSRFQGQHWKAAARARRNVSYT